MNEQFDGPCEPGSEEWHRRLAIFLADDSPVEWLWLSFVDTARSAPPDEQVPGGGGFLGICIVPASNIVQAAAVAGMLGINPGGQVSAYPAVPPGWRPKQEFVGRLFRGPEAVAFASTELEEWAETL